MYGQNSPESDLPVDKSHVSNMYPVVVYRENETLSDLTCRRHTSDTRTSRKNVQGEDGVHTVVGGRSIETVPGSWPGVETTRRPGGRKSKRTNRPGPPTALAYDRCRLRNRSRACRLRRGGPEEHGVQCVCVCV